MVRRNLMIAVLDKQKRLLDDLVTQLLESSQDESGDGLFCIRKAEQVSDNLKKWVQIQRHYGGDEVLKRIAHKPAQFSSEPRQPCQEWMLWLLQCGLIERSHGPVSQSGLYTDFT